MANSRSGESVLERAVRILAALDAHRPRLSVSALARRADLPQATTYRMVGEMVRLGMLERTSDGEIGLGMRLWEMVARTYPVRDLREAALPFLQDVQSVVHQHTQLAILENEQVLVLERLSASRSVVNQATVATRMVVHRTSLGISLLAFAPVRAQEAYRTGHPEAEEFLARRGTDLRRVLAEARQRGYASFDGVLDEGTTGISVPVLDRAGGALAALGVVVPSDFPQRQAIIAVLRAASRGIARSVGEAPPADRPTDFRIE